jgi:hypothetical protein
MISLIRKNNLAELIENVYQTHCILQENAVKAVNQFLIIKNWIVGYYIVEYEQNGSDRAKYGEYLIDEISKKLRDKGLKGYSPMSLRNSRKFYTVYPQIQQMAFVKLQKTDANFDKLFFVEIKMKH